MSIIFNEENYAKNILEKGIQLSSKTNYSLLLVATYLREQGETDKEIELNLHKIAERSFSDYNWVKFYPIVDLAVRKSKRYNLKRNPPITITEKEMNIILGEKDDKIKKLMFVYLVLAKYYMSNNHTDKYYVSYNDTDIFKLCDMFVRKDDRLDFMHYLTTKGYIEPTLYMSSIVYYVHEDSLPVLTFKPDIDMVYYFEQYLGGIFINCSECGKLVKKTNNKTKYCKECAKNKKEELECHRYKVYILTNTVNGLKYVGRTGRSLKERFQNGEGYKNSKIGDAIEKYGWDKFTKELVKDNLTCEESCDLEIKLIKELKTQEEGYNISEGGKTRDAFYDIFSDREPELTKIMKRKKKEFPNSLIYNKTIKEDETYVIYCPEDDVYFKGIKTLCKTLKIQESTVKMRIKRCSSYYKKNFIMSEKKYKGYELTDEIKEVIQNQITKIEMLKEPLRE